jgi:hypothetical protein
MTRLVLPAMRAQGSGVIVNMSSITGRLPAFPAYAFYAAGKHAIGALSESLAAEVAPFGIRVVCVEPGYYTTALTDTVDTLVAQIDPSSPYADVNRFMMDFSKKALVDGGDPADVADAVVAAVADPASGTLEPDRHVRGVRSCGQRAVVQRGRPASLNARASLRNVSTHQDLTDEPFVAVDRNGGMRPLVRVDSNDEHAVLLDQKWFAAAGTPDAGMPFLFRATPQLGNRRADSSLRSQPGGGGALSGPPAGTLDATKPPQRVTRTQASGHYASIVRTRNQDRDSVVKRPMRTLAVAMLTVAITACSGGSHRSLPPPPTTTTPTPSLCRVSQVAVSATQVVSSVDGMLQLQAAVTEPLSGVVTATNAAGARCTVTVPRNGRFTMNLAAGTYRFTGTSPKFRGGSSPCRATYPVVLEPRSIRSQGPSAAVVVICDGF